MTSSSSLGPGYVPPTPTPVSPMDMYAALQVAWPDVLGGETPSRTALLVLLAQWSLETGGGASMIQYNVGNFKRSSMSPLWTEFMTTEVVNGQTEHVEQQFAAWPDLQSGVTAYLQAMHGRFGSAWSYVESGDLDGFAQALKDEGYYTASESLYAAGLQARYNALSSEIPDDNA